MEQDYIPEAKAINHGDRTRDRCQHRTDLAPATGTGATSWVIVLGVFNMVGFALRGVVVGLINNLPRHLHVAGGQSSVDRKHGTRDPSGLIRCEKEGGSCYVLRIADAAKRVPLGDTLEDVGILLPSLFPGRCS